MQGVCVGVNKIKGIEDHPGCVGVGVSKMKRREDHYESCRVCGRGRLMRLRGESSE